MLKEQIEKLLHENDIWKRGFKTLHGQKEEFDRSCQEMQQLRQMISQRDEQLKGLQVAFQCLYPYSPAGCGCLSSELILRNLLCCRWRTTS